MLDLLATFNWWQVQYLIVGGRAVNAYTEARGTKDLDLWVNPTPDNAKRVYAALKEKEEVMDYMARISIGYHCP
jgi:hypothetical protein